MDLAAKSTLENKADENIIEEVTSFPKVSKKRVFIIDDEERPRPIYVGNI